MGKIHSELQLNILCCELQFIIEIDILSQHCSTAALSLEW